MDEVLHSFLEGKLSKEQFQEMFALHYTSEQQLHVELRNCIQICIQSGRDERTYEAVHHLLDMAAGISCLALRKNLLEYMYAQLSPLEGIRSELLAKCCLQLAAVFDAENDYENLCAALETLEKHANLESDLEQLLLLRIRLGENYIKLGKPEKAILLMRTSMPIAHKTNNHQLLMELQLCNARALDETFQFLDAARSYYKALQYKVPGNEIVFIENLSLAIQCLILATPSMIVLQFLQELSLLPNVTELPLFNFIKKYLQRKFITLEDANSILPFLLPHQVQYMHTLIANPKHFLETNLLFVSEFYEVASLENLANYFHITVKELDAVLANMIFQQRIRASIDQFAGYITFLPDSEKMLSRPNYIENISQILNQYG
ncbi:COP9/signalosome complex subunit Csn4 [Schizosaccharomyces cryophilus OY26]|uniref:COP9/signalosome complex subunit Csn4 n=1 Tax=Schizosaccharomyces cryophilus (strain OY26 / ATCC MYA-4695 / CBS 11777 / NBRC 106824 / NRRL Y48691) TaxID=653667 RepID=S9X166_SCHCR|nr:COP9/signalosome complex subunit Csn4 [Schizosaccharomyces cryophilus OY26]EPY50837.1 COP9/signalosome complex subunit Csn4 [Schizosaccharomyces cryophilus OY26]